MARPSKRSVFMDWLFGEQLTGDHLREQKERQPPKLVHYAQQAVRLVLIVVLGASLFNGEGRLPLIGAWLAQTSWGVGAIWVGCLSILAGSEWFYKRRTEASRRP